MPTQKVLPIKYPLITSLPAFANTNAILCTYEEAYYPWFIHNHIQLVGWGNPEVYLQFYTPVFREYYRLFTMHHYEKRVLSKWCDNIVQFIIDAIDDGNYVYLSIDQYYISSYRSFNKWHGAHDMLIYGYDQERGIFYIADFFDTTYCFSEADFKSVNKAFLSPYSEGEWFKGVQLLKFKDHKIEFKFDLKLLIKQLKEYLYETKSSVDYKLIEEPGNDSDSWGIGVYPFLINYIKENEEFVFSLVRSVHLLSDHKEVMLRGLEYLNTLNLITEYDLHFEAYTDIKKQCLVLRNICLKYMLTESTKDIQHVIDFINQIEIKERKAIQKLILDLEKVK
ncbi:MULTISPECIES: BtrH N-terminal domain-containing protein [Paenibacillus]|uniref:BtrH N-terminal domain-containing protein n=1 Tax=Paenibacillus TaxID=44249 RepID=UPI0012B710C3|nr:MULTISPECIES: BtrH N-terminal domain-containing protein [Paenibacillus]